jgi:hypothetical protein
MLFIGLGPGLGSTLISGKVIVPLELGRMPYSNDESLEDVLGRKGLKRLGQKQWEHCSAIDSKNRCIVKASTKFRWMSVSQANRMWVVRSYSLRSDWSFCDTNWSRIMVFRFHPCDPQTAAQHAASCSDAQTAQAIPHGEYHESCRHGPLEDKWHGLTPDAAA